MDFRWTLHNLSAEQRQLKKKKETTGNVWDLFLHRQLRIKTLLLLFIWFSISAVYFGLAMNLDIGKSSQVQKAGPLTTPVTSETSPEPLYFRKQCARFAASSEFSMW